MPGGCPIGVRPVDLHLKGFSLLGAEIKQEHGNIEISSPKIKGNNIYLDFPSVGATENIIMASVMAEGETYISNCSVEPEIINLADFLNKMGAKVFGAGTDNIKIIGVKELFGTAHKIIPDRIEAGTFMIGAVITKGDVTIKNVVRDHLRPVIAKLKDMNVDIEEKENMLRVRCDRELVNTDIKTLPFPGFPTDMQAQFMSLMAVTNGTGIINETIFENRFMHVGELNRMGADIKVESKSAIIKGVSKLTGTQVKATDLRAGAALILSALVAEGETEISDIYHIERGYYRIEEKFKKLGAKIKKL
jgi:UDP-N-acetylglucosamine 1-carboxyvinyltransferase